MLRWGRFISVLTSLINRIICLALSIMLLVVAVIPDLIFSGGSDATIQPTDLESFRPYLAGGGLLLLMLNLNIIQFISYNLWNNDHRRYIFSKTQNGTTRVSLDAVEGALVAAAHGVPEIDRCKLRVFRIGGKRYKVEVRYWIPNECNVLNINEKLRLVLKKRFSELVSIQHDDKVFFDISLAGFKGKRKTSGPGPGSYPANGPGASKSQFKGPVYPIDGEV